MSLANAQAELEKAQASGNKEDIEYWSKVVEEADSKVQEAAENFESNWENALQMAADAFSSSVENIAEEFSKAVSGIYDSLEEMQSAFERLQEVEERYLADYEKTYEISKLNRKIMESID